MNYYEILKISENATGEEIKNAYKKLVKKYHPDLFEGDKNFAEEKIKQINQAYDILSVPQKKAEYDNWLHPKSSPYSVSNSPHQTQSSYTQTNHSSAKKPLWSLSEFLTKKINQLDSKQQLQAFILILVIIFALFLINLIQAKFYFENKDSANPSDKIKPSSPPQNTYYNYDLPNNSQTIDDLIYDFLWQYEQAFEDKYEEENFK